MRKKGGIKILVFYLVATLGTFVPSISAFAQSNILTVYTDNTGMVTPQGKKLYVKVTAAGRMKYTDQGKQGYYTRERTLTKAELARLRDILQSPALSTAAETLHADPAKGANDYLTDLLITIPRDRSAQRIRLVGFNGCPGRDFPPGVKDLLLVVDELRASAYRLSSSCENPDQAKTVALSQSLFTNSSASCNCVSVPIASNSGVFSTATSGSTPAPSIQCPLQVYQPATGIRRRYPLDRTKFVAPSTSPAERVPTSFANWFSLAKAATISVALWE